LGFSGIGLVKRSPFVVEMNAVHFFVERCSLLPYIAAVNIVHNRSRQMFKTVVTQREGRQAGQSDRGRQAERLLMDVAKAP
jgi:hypothetical protein